MKSTVTRTLVFVILMLVMTLPSAFAQPKAYGSFKGGLNLADLWGEESENLDTKKAFAFGGSIAFVVSKQVYIQPEILYTMKGAKAEEEEMGAKAEFDVRLAYLEIPVLVKLMVPTQGNVAPHFFAGPAIAFCLSAETNVRVKYHGAVLEDETVDIQNDVQDIDFGLVFGGGVDFAVDPGKITTEFRYTHGAMSIFEDEDIRNGVISFMAGYTFPIGQ